MAWNHVSASQVENYQKCHRAWYFKSVVKVSEAQTGSQALGTSFHLICEKVPKGLPYPINADTNASPEEWDKAVKMATIALPLIPTDASTKLPIHREIGIKLETYPNGPLFVGYIDLAIPPGVGWEALLIPKEEAIIGDYKTLSDFRYMKTPEELANSVQMMSYAKWAISPGGLFTPQEGDLTPVFPNEPNGLGRETVRLLHFYARSKPPFIRSSIRYESAIVGISQINDFWGKTLDTVREMEQTSKCGSADDVEAGGALNGHCEAYGGCSFREKCGIAKESGIKTLFQISKKPKTNEETPVMSGSAIMDKIIAARALAANGGKPVAPAPVVATSAESAGPSTPSGALVETAKPAIEASSPAESQALTPVKEVVPAKPSAGPISGLMAKIEAAGKGKPALGGSAAQAYGKENGNPNAPGYAGTGELGAKTIHSVADLMKLAQGVLPSDAPARTQDVITTPGTPVVDPLTEFDGPAEGAPGEEADDNAEGESVPGGTGGSVDSTPVATNPAPAGNATTPAPVASGVEGPKRGRPSKEATAAKELAERKAFDERVDAEVTKRIAMVGTGALTVTATDAQTAEKMISLASERDALTAQILKEREKSAQEITLLKAKLSDHVNVVTGAPAPSAPTGTTLYIDCYPVKGSVEGLVDFFEWVQPICQAVAQGNGVADYRLIQYNSKGLLATHIRELVRAEGMPKAMTIPSYAAGADIALEVLTPLARHVIRKI